MSIAQSPTAAPVRDSSGQHIIRQEPEGWMVIHLASGARYRVTKTATAGVVCVTSSSSLLTYTVRFYDRFCSCPDHARRSRACKHMKAVDALADWCAAKRQKAEEQAADTAIRLRQSLIAHRAMLDGYPNADAYTRARWQRQVDDCEAMLEGLEPVQVTS